MDQLQYLTHIDVTYCHRSAVQGLVSGSEGEATHAKKPPKRLIKRKAILESDDEEEAATPMEDSGDESGSEFIGADAAPSESESDESAAASDEV